jgi:hypothetical protein
MAPLHNTKTSILEGAAAIFSVTFGAARRAALPVAGCRLPVARGAAMNGTGNR